MIRRMREPRGSQIATDGIFQFVIVLNGDEFAAVSKSFGQAKGRVAGERAELEDATGTDHTAEHTQQFALHLTGKHVRVEDVQIGVACDTRQELRFGSGVLLDVVLYRTHIVNGYMYHLYLIAQKWSMT